MLFTLELNMEKIETFSLFTPKNSSNCFPYFDVLSLMKFIIFFASFNVFEVSSKNISYDCIFLNLSLYIPSSFLILSILPILLSNLSTMSRILYIVSELFFSVST